MPTEGPTHLVFVDFENVPSVDLAVVAGLPVHVTLLIGEKQKKLELTFVRQIHRHAAQVTLIEVGTSGRNALDLVLACHLGQAVLTHPDATFHIISRDKDFNPLVAHLRANEVNIARHDGFAALPFLQPAAQAQSPAPDRRLVKLINRLRDAEISRPVRRKTLFSHIQDFFGNRLDEHELEAIVSTLQDRGVIQFDEKGHVSYPESATDAPAATGESFTYVQPVAPARPARAPRRPRRPDTPDRAEPGTHPREAHPSATAAGPVRPPRAHA